MLQLFPLSNVTFVTHLKNCLIWKKYTNFRKYVTFKQFFECFD